MMMMIIIIIFRKYLNNIPAKHEIKNYREKPYWKLHTYFGKYYRKERKK
jgi:hypothetical protein